MGRLPCDSILTIVAFFSSFCRAVQSAGPPFSQAGGSELLPALKTGFISRCSLYLYPFSWEGRISREVIRLNSIPTPLTLLFLPGARERGFDNALASVGVLSRGLELFFFPSFTSSKPFSSGRWTWIASPVFSPPQLAFSLKAAEKGQCFVPRPSTQQGRWPLSLDSLQL